MQFTREINRLLMGILLLFGFVAVAAAYWAISGPDTILQRQDNPRLVETEAELIRGRILDRNNNVLVESEQNRDRSITRHYLYPEMYSALGYASLRYGVGGAEAAYNTILRGDEAGQDPGDKALRDLLHYPQLGADVRLTLDLGIQKAAVEAMGEHWGAVVVLSVPSGEVLALASLPTYDPNQLDLNWEQLTKDPGNPFFNRALQGKYQPGGTLETLLVGAALLANYPLDTVTSEASQPVRVGNVEVPCVMPVMDESLSLREGYMYGCPQPFANLVDALGLGPIQGMFDAFLLGHAPTLPGYVVNNPDQPTATPETINLNGVNILENALGQGRLRITPLEMAILSTAVLNDGNAPSPYTLLDTRLPDTSTWIASDELHPSIPLVTANTARQLQDIMRATVSEGSAQAAQQPDIDIGGHTALAYSGTDTQTWFVGFASLGGRRGIAISVVVEKSADREIASQIGGEVLRIAYERLHQ